eukprot:gb/GECH01003504.1/.p1 GENE.gb/GECH01003504.1/~~gb/GECH01003504.1/.p1  ORF type:complete len:487 (+),score=178.05 gb/GECH01003504.1/:1-1461(+)
MQSQEWEDRLEKLASEESENLVKNFQEVFEECTEAVQKPNILLAGITGAGKSTLVNSVFGEELAQAGAGMPVTQHFQKFEPQNKPICIYDSKGLELSAHEEFIKETGEFFVSLREKEDVSEHIHVVWYVVNTARGRFEEFEASLIREVFAPTPVIFVLNKADLADASQLRAAKDVIEKEEFSNNKGIFINVSQRQNWSQPWCPSCISDDVFYDEETRELECAECGFTDILEETYNLQNLISHTCELLPDLAKDAFMYAQTASMTQKDDRARQMVKESTHEVSLDTKGTFINKLAEMCAHLFVIWGWPLTAGTFKEGLGSMQKEYINQLKLSERVAASTMDRLFGSRLSKGFTGIIGIAMNRGMKRLNSQLIDYAAKGELEKMNVEEFLEEDDFSEDMMQLFFAVVFKEGADAAIDKFWDISMEEVAVLSQQLNVQDYGLDNAKGEDDEENDEDDNEGEDNDDEDGDKKEDSKNQKEDSKPSQPTLD